jgi:lipopolysaccharide transport system permease protein
MINVILAISHDKNSVSVAKESQNKEIHIKPPSGMSLDLRELWKFRELLYFYAWRDIKVKYKQTILGVLWAILQPILLTVIFIFFFSKALNISTAQIPPPLFYLSGLLIWNLFSSGLSGATNSIVSNAAIIKKIYFPRLIIPFSSIVVSLFDFLMAFVVLIFVAGWYKINGSSFPFFELMLRYIPALIITLLASVGLGSLLSAYNVLYRDFRYIIPFFIQLLLFITPVIYPVEIFNNPLFEKLLAINPLTGAIHIVRTCFLNDPISWPIVWISSISSLLFFTLGLLIFKKIEPRISDMV